MIWAGSHGKPLLRSTIVTFKDQQIVSGILFLTIVEDISGACHALKQYCVASLTQLPLDASIDRKLRLLSNNLQVIYIVLR